jgi:hypothetical protein
MTGKKDHVEHTAGNQAEGLLKQLMHLKTYETPETARMTRNKQNIMREIRNAQANKRKSLGDLLELNMPWFFAEPKYGIAALFIAFVGLQYVGMHSRTSSQSTGIYTSTTPDYANPARPQVTISTNRYPQLPGNRALFDSPEGGDGSVLPAGFKYRE